MVRTKKHENYERMEKKWEEEGGEHGGLRSEQRRFSHSVKLNVVQDNPNEFVHQILLIFRCECGSFVQ